MTYWFLHLYLDILVITCCQGEEIPTAVNLFIKR